MVAGRIDASLTRTKATPLAVPRTTRMQDVRTLTSLPAGRMVPLCFIPLLREDSIRRCQLRLSFEMMETVEILLNAVNVDVKAYLVSTLAFDRFDGMDALNRSFAGVAVEGLSVIPFYRSTAVADVDANLIYKYLGLHAKDGTVLNQDIMEAYNQIWNMRARNRSKDLVPRGITTATLAPAFWKHQHFRHVVPDFDQAVIDGEVPLNVASARMPISGIATVNTELYTSTAAATWRQPDGQTVVGSNWSNVGADELKIRGDNTTKIPDVFAELEENGITVSLSNIEMARKTQAFARLKEQYQGIPDDYIVDLLMQGIRIPDQALNQPILIGEASTIFGMSKRYATDSTALTESVVSGATFVDLTFRVPQLNTGGIVMVTAEITPEQLFERQADPFFFMTDVAQAPDYLRDTLDPEKVDVVTNVQVDAAHATPTGTFGYAPLNSKWIIQQPRIGGRFYRPDPADTTNDEDRNRIWAVETVNPTLAADFYICTNIHTKPFVVQNQDPFECVVRGMAIIEGNTVFGGALVESTGSYDEVLAEAPIDRIDKPVGGAPLGPETKPGPKAAKETAKAAP